MKAAMVLIASLCLMCASGAYAQDEKPPVPPAREHNMGEVLEQGAAVTAETAAPAEQAIIVVEQAAASAEKAVEAVAPVADSAQKAVAVETTTVEVVPAPAPASAEAAAPAETPAAETAPAETVTESATVVEVQPVPVQPRVEPAPVETPAPTAPSTAEIQESRETAVKDVETAEKPAEPEGLAVTPSPSRPHEMQVPPARPAPNNRGEVELVERVAVARESYRLALEALKQHYINAANATKLQWAEKELNELNMMDQYHYLTEMDLAGPDLKPVASVAAADQLYKEGMEFKNYPAFPPEKKDKLKIALEKFRTIIEDYPTSDKIDDAAFRMGEIYGGWYFQDYPRAVSAYERCFQWNPQTMYPARFNAAKIYDEKLLQRDKAIELYRLVIRDDVNTEHVAEATKRVNELSPQK